MLSLRLQRVGKKHDPSFRVVLTDKRNATKSGKFLEILGSYDARKNAPTLNKDRVEYWISKGAQPSGSVHNLLVDAKIVKGSKIRVTKIPAKAVEKTAEAAPAAAESTATATA